MITNTIETKSDLNSIKSDIQHAIDEEHSYLHVTHGDIAIVDKIKKTVESLEMDYERLHDKIILAIYQRVDKVGKEHASNDEVVQLLKSILSSEHKKEDKV